MKKMLGFVILLLLSYNLAPAQDSNSKAVIAILDLNGEGTSKMETKAITNLLTTSIYETDLVSVIDRNQREEILTEIKFSLSGCADESCAIEVGKLLAADIMVIGSLDSIGSRLAIDLKALDVSTSTIVGSFYEIYESVDDIVDAVDVIGGQFVQNFTGQMAAKKTVLQYENLIPLTVLCNVENAAVYIDGNAIGKITKGTIAKAININAEVLVEVVMEGYYPFVEMVMMDERKEISAVLTPINSHTTAMKAVVGGGMMGSLSFSWLFVPNWVYAEIALGFTITSFDPLLVNIPFSVRGGTYLFLDDRSRIRPYAGGVIIYDAATWYDYSTFILRDPELFWYGFNFGGYGGAELKLGEHFRIHGDISLFLNEVWQGMRNLVQIGIGITVM